jgi:hypothetical protein
MDSLGGKVYFPKQTKKSKHALGFNEWQLRHFTSYVGYIIGMHSIKIPRKMHMMSFPSM